MMLQLSLAIDSHHATKQGELKLSALKEHAIQVFNGMAQTIRSSVLPSQDENPSAQFLFGGYSWFKKSFQLWHFAYQPKIKTFVANPVPWVGYREQFQSVGWSYGDQSHNVKRITQIGMIGDAPQVKVARGLLSKRIKENASKNIYTLNMEPFEVIRGMLRKASTEGTIGGSPQIVVVHQFMQATPIGVYWPNKSDGGVFIQGRRTVGYENINRYILDPDTLELESPYLPEIPAAES